MAGSTEAAEVAEGVVHTPLDVIDIRCGGVAKGALITVPFKDGFP